MTVEKGKGHVKEWENESKMGSKKWENCAGVVATPPPKWYVGM